MAIFDFFNATKNKNREFWFSHLVVLVSTVLGVYLAASAGLKTAIEFELIKSDRDSYYMRAAFLDELRDNADKMESWGKEYRGGKARKFIGNPDDFKLDDFIWLTMRDNPGTFEIPGEILTGVRRYYSSAQTTLRKMTGKKPAAKEVDDMLGATETFRKDTIIKLEEDVAKLRTKLEGIDIPL